MSNHTIQGKPCQWGIGECPARFFYSEGIVTCFSFFLPLPSFSTSCFFLFYACFADISNLLISISALFFTDEEMELEVARCQGSWWVSFLILLSPLLKAHTMLPFLLRHHCYSWRSHHENRLWEYPWLPGKYDSIVSWQFLAEERQKR